jgi:hypothetical protein
MANLMKAFTLIPAREGAVRAVRLAVARAAWSIKRTGRLGLAGIALLGASLVFFVSTYLQLSGEARTLSGQLESLGTQRAVPRKVTISPQAQLLRNLPARDQMPSLLGVLLSQASAAHLTIDSGKYEESSLKVGGLVRCRVTFPLTGAYPQIRQFIDALLTALPTVAVSELSVQRKTIADGTVEAQVGLTVFTREKS